VEDILLDENGDLAFLGGDFALGNSKYQSQNLLLITDKNDWKEFPEMGVGLSRFLDDEGHEDLAREIREQFRMDGQQVKKLEFYDGKIGIVS